MDPPESRRKGSSSRHSASKPASPASRASSGKGRKPSVRGAAASGSSASSPEGTVQPGAESSRSSTNSTDEASETTKAAARFFCPVCKRWRPYEVKRARKLFPLSLRGAEESGDEVECRLCSRTFPLSALEYDPKAERQAKSQRREQFAEAMQQAMAAMVLINGSITFREVEAMRSIIQQVTGHPCDNPQLDAALKGVRGRLDAVIASLRELRDELSEKRRHMILRAVVHVAVASGSIDSSQGTLARRVGEALGLGPRTVRQVIESSESGSSQSNDTGNSTPDKT